MTEPLDLGSGATLRYVQFDPELDINPQYQHLADQLPVEKFGAVVRHPIAGKGQTGEDGWCEGMITFDIPIAREVAPTANRWTVHSWDPLDLDPSIQCSCGFHGHVDKAAGFRHERLETGLAWSVCDLSDPLG